MATQCYEHGLPLAQAMKITGHKKLSTLQKYIKSDSDIQMMFDIGNSIGKNVWQNIIHLLNLASQLIIVILVLIIYIPIWKKATY